MSSFAAALVLAALLSVVAGWRLHGPQPGLLVADALQGVVGGALALVTYSLTGPIADGALELALVAGLGAWAWLGAAHLTVAILGRLGS